MGIRQFLERSKAHPVVTGLVAVAAVAGFVVGFGQNLATLCGWLGLCSPQSSHSALAQLSYGLDRAYVEQESILGPPRYRMDEASSGYLFADREHDDETAYEYATYFDEWLSYTIRYDSATQQVGAIRLESAREDEDCAGSDLTQFAVLQEILERSTPLCLGQATFADFFPHSGGSIRNPQGSEYSSAICWGGLSMGGASGHGSYVSVTCSWIRPSLADADLNYLIDIGIEGIEVAHGNYSFDERSDPATGSFDAFLSLAKLYRIQYIDFYP